MSGLLFRIVLTSGDQVFAIAFSIVAALGTNAGLGHHVISLLLRSKDPQWLEPFLKVRRGGASIRT